MFGGISDVQWIPGSCQGVETGTTGNRSSLVVGGGRGAGGGGGRMENKRDDQPTNPTYDRTLGINHPLYRLVFPRNRLDRIRVKAVLHKSLSDGKCAGPRGGNGLVMDDGCPICFVAHD